jgi:hypothetical protein
MTSIDPAALAVHFANALEAAGVPYAIGGAIAYGFWGVPRGTRDLDINVFLSAEQADAAIDALVPAGLEIDRAAARRRSTSFSSRFRCTNRPPVVRLGSRSWVRRFMSCPRKT